jgi:hypothetical protein
LKKPERRNPRRAFCLKYRNYGISRDCGVLRHFRNCSDNPKKNLTRRANQGYINIIARADRARAEKSAAGFLFEISQSDGGRTSRRPTSQPVALSVASCRRPSLIDDN